MRLSSAVNDRNFKMSYNATKVDATFNFHAHDGYEIYYFCSGQVQYYIEDQSYHMVAGDVLVIPPGRMHRMVTVDEKVEYARIVINLSEDYCKRLMARVSDHFVFSGVGTFLLTDTGLKEQMLRLLDLEAGEAGTLERDAIVTLLLLTLDRLMKDAPATEGKDHSLAQVIRYIDANFTREVTLEEIAERFFISKYHLLRRFKALTNSTVHQYILTKRILLAKALLRQGMRPAAVATECGFQTYSGFYQVFYNQTGQKPSSFQKK